MERWLTLFCCWLMAASGFAQSDWREAWQEWMTAQDVEEHYGEELAEWLEDRAAHPINLNQTSREELEQLPFLSAAQVEGIVAYLDRYHPVRSETELMMIEPLDWHTRRLLLHFVRVGDEPPQRAIPRGSDIARHGRHTLRATAKVPFYTRRGDREGYLGYRYRHDVRYQFDYDNRVKFGLTAAQDAGEPFFGRGNAWGYDHYSYYVQLRNMGRIEALNVGMYRVQMGMGLLMNTGIHLGKAATLQTMGRSTRVLTAHSSRSEAGYMQGAATTVRLDDHWRATAFLSWRPLDATLNDDGTVRTVLSSGYHRTPTEMQKKHNTHRTDLGGSVGWRKGALHASANAVFTRFDRDLQPPSTALYRRYAARGNGFFNASLDYGYTNHRWSVAGETALNRRGNVAMIHSVALRASSEWSLLLLHRYYDQRYTALHARSFSEGSGVQNEHGLYLGATWRPHPQWLLQGYADYAHFPWMRYQVSAPSDAFDALVSARYEHNPWKLTARYRYHLRQRDNGDHTMLVNRTTHSLRLSASCDATRQLTLATQADGTAFQQPSARSLGIMVSQRLRWQHRWLRTDASVGWFHTADYDSRIYQYEPTVPYDFGFPMYYGHGIRYALMLRADAGKRLTAVAKMGVTNYFDRSTTGTALQQVDHSSLADLLLQVCYKL